MSTVDTNNTTNTNSTTSSSSSSSTGAMSQSDFLKLMVAQLQAQDPTNPVDNQEFASQMAQFSTLSATQDLNTTVTSLASQLTSASQTNQVLSSANLVGRDVMVPATTTAYDGSTATKGAVNVATAGAVVINITDASGNAVRTINLGTQSEGLSQFTWDGKDDSGKAVAAGTYTLAATDAGTSANTFISGTVTGVGYGGSSVGTYLQVAGVGGVPLAQVAQIL
ncbi:MAG TPA: flagellar hook capping FlgD N-terminal domain-containing protein [Pinirhizobacter sp.]|uniref:flagellar hook assembly protein FlgD n=1 Tax=Pinirhizobacter sp. TaxID=2950432 RepID=UPI002BCF6129|nr:flagellar hook capping FlgD N-terminal domain-containing protein [Pinirhizobacter sp.]HMH68410.1 flagellar hook capping FlgD N-terminal domain-containing protein [Pinirhizobacter sp.]